MKPSAASIARTRAAAARKPRLRWRKDHRCNKWLDCLHIVGRDDAHVFQCAGAGYCAGIDSDTDGPENLTLKEAKDWCVAELQRTGRLTRPQLKRTRKAV